MTKEQFTKLLDSHDWDYEMSDDHGVYVRGSAQEATILQVVAMFPELNSTLDEYKRIKLGE
jgi:hypothetical protein